MQSESTGVSELLRHIYYRQTLTCLPRSGREAAPAWERDGNMAPITLEKFKPTGPTRTVTAIHHSGSAKRHGSVNPGEGDIGGGRR
jgi:hypothetical protein